MTWLGLAWLNQPLYRLCRFVFDFVFVFVFAVGWWANFLVSLISPTASIKHCSPSHVVAFFPSHFSLSHCLGSSHFPFFSLFFQSSVFVGRTQSESEIGVHVLLSFTFHRFPLSFSSSSPIFAQFRSMPAIFSTLFLLTDTWCLLLDSFTYCRYCCRC